MSICRLGAWRKVVVCISFYGLSGAIGVLDLNVRSMLVVDTVVSGPSAVVCVVFRWAVHTLAVLFYVVLKVGRMSVMILRLVRSARRVGLSTLMRLSWRWVVSTVTDLMMLVVRVRLMMMVLIVVLLTMRNLFRRFVWA